MDIDTFTTNFSQAICPGMILQNPGGGTSKIVSIRDGKVRYKRRSSTMGVSLNVLFEMYVTFKGRSMSSPELKKLLPAVFDSAARPAGHSCNATFFFLALREMGIVSAIQGEGKAGNPFFVQIPN